MLDAAVQLAHCPDGFEAFEHGVRVGQGGGAALPGETVWVFVALLDLRPVVLSISTYSMCIAGTCGPCSPSLRVDIHAETTGGSYATL